MRFVLLFKPDPDPPPGGHDCKANRPEMAELIGRLKAAGTLVSAVGLLGGECGARVRLSGGRLTVTDGPFAEAKDLVGGVAVVEAGSKSEAVELARQFLAVAGGGESEVRAGNELGDAAPVTSRPPGTA